MDALRSLALRSLRAAEPSYALASFRVPTMDGRGTRDLCGFPHRTKLPLEQGQSRRLKIVRHRERSFCRRCGTPLAYEADGYESGICLALGALHEPDRLRPGSHVHVAQKGRLVRYGRRSASLSSGGSRRSNEKASALIGGGSLALEA